MAVDLPFDATHPTAVMVCILRNALAKDAPLAQDAIFRPFEEVHEEWGALSCVQGSEEAIAEVLHANLCRIVQDKAFLYFRVHRREQGVIQTTASLDGRSVPLLIWKAGDQFLTCGDSSFSCEDDDTDDDDERASVPPTMWGEGSTCLACHTGKLDTSMWEGTSRALLRSLPLLLNPVSIALNTLRIVLDPDDKLPATGQLKCDRCSYYAIRCPYCYHVKPLGTRLPAFQVLRCELCDQRFRTYRDG